MNNALNHHWSETSLLPQAILKHACGVQRFHDFIVKKSMHVGPVLYPYKNKEIYDIVSFQTMSFCILQYLSMWTKSAWVICGSHMYCSALWVSESQVGQQV